MIDGKYSPNMNYQHFGRHIRDRFGLIDADEYDETRTEILANAMAVDSELSKMIGTGEARMKRGKLRELIYCPSLTGVIHLEGKEIATHYFEIHHSNSGWHTVPVLR